MKTNKLMKKQKILLIVIMLFSISFMVACSNESNNSNDKVIDNANSTGDVANDSNGDNNVNSNNTNNNNLAGGNVTVSEEVLLDEKGLLITLKSLEMDNILGPALKIEIVNNTDKNITVQATESAVNGAMIDTVFSSDIAAGKKANDSISFLSNELEVAGITTIKDFEFKFHIFDAATWDTIFDSDTIHVATSAENVEQTFNKEGFVAFDQKGYRIVLQKLNSEDSFWGSDIYVFIENNSDRDVTIQASDVSINGYMIEPVFSSDVLAGKVAYDTITFFDDDLTENNITSIDEIELSFKIFDMDSFETIYESDVITTSFVNE